MIQPQYEQAALNALQEVANALVSREKLEAVRALQAPAVAACQDAVETSRQRYLAGKSGDYEVLEAQLQLFPAETDVAQTQINQRAVVVQLYKALGGGWQTEPAAVPSPSR